MRIGTSLRRGLALPLAAALWLAAPAAPALDRERSIAEFYHTAWTVKEGAPGQVTALAQSADGDFWLGTYGGLYRFDGIQFERYAAPASTPLPSANISALHAPAGGGLWIGYRYGGASFLHAGRLTSYGEADGFSTGSVYGFASDRAGSVWAATFQGLMRFHDGRWHWVRQDHGVSGRQARAVFVDRDDGVWIGTETAVQVLRAGAQRFEVAAPVGGLVSRLAQAADGTLWVAESDGMVRPVAPASGGLQDAPAGLAIAASSILFDRDGTLWVGGAGDGIRRLPYPEQHAPSAAVATRAAVQSFDEQGGLSADFVGPALEDREGNLWFGTARGLDRFRASRFVPAGFPPGAYDFALVAGEAGAMWAGTRNRPLMRRHGSELTVSDWNHDVSCAYRDADATIWLGGPDGIWRLLGDTPTRFAPIPAQARGSTVQALTRDPGGTLWASFNVPGIFRHRDGAWSHVERFPGLVERASPLTLMTDRRGRVWLGYSRNRITRIEGEHMRLFNAADGLDVGNVSALLAGRAQTWVGGERGLAYLDGERFRSLRAAGGVTLNGISGLVERANGDLWLNGSDGVTRIPAAEIERVVADPALAAWVQHYDFLDGLPGGAAQFRPLPTAVEGSDGRLWFATTSGVVWLDPERLDGNPLPPTVQIRALYSGGQRHAAAAGMRLPARTRELQIHYSASSLSIPERVRFRYRLEGLDGDWHEAGNRREAGYTNLGPGDYVFRVIAANEDGIWSEAGAVLAFAIEPTFVEGAVFRALCLVAAAGLLWLLYWLRLRTLAGRIRARLQERHLERERIARELHDTLLQSVQGLILRVHAAAQSTSGATRQALESALDRADAVLAEGRDRVNELRAASEHASDLPGALEALGLELAREHPVRFRLEVSGEQRELSPLVRDEAYRIGREALLNAFHHAQANWIELDIAYEPRRFWLRVSDDGRGIEASILEAGGRPGHWGLTGMKERARRVGGSFEVWSRSGAGTEIELQLPAAIAYVRDTGALTWWQRWRR